MPRTKTGWRRRLARELIPGLIGIGAVALMTTSASQQALGVILEPLHSQTSACSSFSPRAGFDCIADASDHAPEGHVDDD